MTGDLAREPRTIPLAELADHVGSTLGTSRWWEIDERRVEAFANATGDRARRHDELARPTSTLAQGFLVLSLAPAIRAEVFTVSGCEMTINYGLEGVRFPAALPVGRRLRGRFELVGLTPAAGGTRALVRGTFEGEGVDQPVCVADAITHFVARASA